MVARPSRPLMHKTLWSALHPTSCKDTGMRFLATGYRLTGSRDVGGSRTTPCGSQGGSSLQLGTVASLG